MSCLSEKQDQALKKVSMGKTLTIAERSQLISLMMQNDKKLLHDSLQFFDPRISVYKTDKGEYTITESSKEKLTGDIEVFDEETFLNKKMDSKAFHTDEDKHKIPTTLTVNSIISSIPFINELPVFSTLLSQRYSYHRTLPVKQTRQLLYDIYTRQGFIEDSNQLKEILEEQIQVATLPDTQRRILSSVYLYLFAQEPVLMKNELQKVTEMKSLAVIAETSPDPNVRSRAFNYQNIFHTAIVAPNNFSSLMRVSEDGNASRSMDDRLLYRMMVVNTGVANNLFTIKETEDALTSKVSTEVEISKQVKQAFKEKGVLIGRNLDGDTVLSFLHEYSNGARLRIEIPFSFSPNKEHIIDVVKVKKYLIEKQNDKLLKEGYSEKDAYNAAQVYARDILENPAIITDVLSAFGYDDIVTEELVRSILKTEDNNKLDKAVNKETKIDNLWRLVATTLVSIGTNLTYDKSIDVSKNVSKEVAAELNRVFGETYSNIPLERHPMNIMKSINKSGLIEDGLDAREYDSKIMSPIAFQGINNWLTGEIISHQNLYNRPSQHNVENSKVDINNTASRAEGIVRYLRKIKELVVKGIRSVFRTNPIVNEDVFVEGIRKIDGYENKDKTGKSHMSMNEVEVARVTYSAYLNELVNGFNVKDGIFKTILAIPQIYSDKSFWGGFVLRSKNKNFMPLTPEGKVDVNTLLKDDVKIQRDLDTAFTENFIDVWNEMYYVHPETGHQHKFKHSTVESAMIMSDYQALDTFIKELETMSVPVDSPISGIVNKYYNLKNTTLADGSVVSRITINPLLKQKLFRYVKMTDADYKLESLKALVVNHNKMIKLGVDLANPRDDFAKSLNKKVETLLDDKKHVDRKFSRGSKGPLEIDENSTLDEYVEKIQDLNPIEVSQFFAHNYSYNALNDVLLGSKYQYKNKSTSEMLLDMLKRSVMAASPGIPLSLDSTKGFARKKGDRRMTRMSKVMFIKDESTGSYVLGTGTKNKVDIYDGGSFTTKLAELLYQTSFGGIQGLMPNSSLKFFYANTDLTTADAQLVKYAAHVITEEQLDMGTPRLWNMFKLQLGGMSLGREITLPDVHYAGEVVVPSKTFSAEDTLFDMFMYIKESKAETAAKLDTQLVLFDLMAENPDLKDRFVHQLIVESSNKTGKRLYHNIDNLTTRLDKGEKINEWELGEIDNADLVMQLDATHDVEESSVSKFSQAFTNAIQEGRTFPKADLLLRKMAELSGLNLEKMKRIFTHGELDLEDEIKISDLKLESHPDFKGHFEKNYSPKDIKSSVISHINDLPKEERTKLFIRASVMESMEQQKNTNTTYKDLESNSFSMQSPMTAGLIESAVRSHINRKTVAFKFPGGNNILAPSHGLFAVYDVVVNGVNQVVVGAKNLQRLVGEKITKKEIKPGVEELFDSNPELANTVYKSLGFNQLVTPNDKIVFGHPGIGKTFLKDSGRKEVIDFDSDYKKKVNEMFNLPKGFKARNDFQKSNKEEYKNTIRNLWEEAKLDAKSTGKQLFASDMILLREFANDFDKVITMSKDTFVERARQRNDYTPGLEGTEGWKNSLDTEIAKIDKSKVFTTDKYLSDLLLNPRQKQKALQVYSQYLDTIFPDSEVKDIVYHGSDTKFEDFLEDNLNYFGTKDIAKGYGKNIYPVLIEIKKPYSEDGGNLSNQSYEELYNKLDESNSDGFISNGKNLFVPKSEEQIHVLGSPQDIEGFKKFKEIHKDTSEYTHRDLKWAGITNENGDSFMDPSNPVWENFRTYAEMLKEKQENKQILTPLEKAEYIRLKGEMQKALDEGKWTVHPAEVIMPFSYKKKFSLLDGMQPNDVTVDYYRKISQYTVEASLMEKSIADNLQSLDSDMIAVMNSKVLELQEKAEIEAQQRYEGFQKALEVLVGRIPSTGMQSIVSAKIVGFIESNKNTLWFPKELMMIQGADLDIDKAVIMSWNFDEKGILISDNSSEGKQNQVTQLLTDITRDPKNQIVANSPVTLEEFQEERDARSASDLDAFVPSDRDTFTMVMLKVLASEGKSMVGVFANLYKTYNYLFYTETLRRTKGLKSIVKPVSFFNGKEVKKLDGLANINPKEYKTQTWGLYSMLVNAATDNAKEMILGAIKANMQTGNLIGLLANYGMSTKEIFDYLSQPEIQKVLELLRHSANVGNRFKSALTIEKAIKKLEKKKAFNPKEKMMYDGLLTLSRSTEELATLAGVLGINRELPVSAYDRFNLRQKVENYINKQFEMDAELNRLPDGSKKKPLVFDLHKFVDPLETSYIGNMKSRYFDIAKSYNMLEVLDQSPDINAYLQAHVFTDNTIKALNDKYTTAENIIKSFKEYYKRDLEAQAGTIFESQYFNNIKEDEYKGIIRFLEENVVSEYITNTPELKTLTTYIKGDKLTYDSSNLEDVAKFQLVFPEFMMELKKSKDNPAFTNNVFFKSLQKDKTKNGIILRVPNIDSLEKTEQFTLQFYLNSFTSDINYHGEVISNKEFKKMVFAYSLINSKGKVSTSSFFEMLDDSYKSLFGYNEFLNKNPNILTGLKLDNSAFVSSSPHINTALSSLLPQGRDFFDEGDSTSQGDFGSENLEKVSFLADQTPDRELPPFVQAMYAGSNRTYKLHMANNTQGVPLTHYSIVKPIFKPTTLSVSKNGSQITHVTERDPFKLIYDLDTIVLLSDKNRKKNVPLNARTSKHTKGMVPLPTNVGVLNYDSDNQEVVKKC